MINSMIDCKTRSFSKARAVHQYQPFFAPEPRRSFKDVQKLYVWDVEPTLGDEAMAERLGFEMWALLSALEGFRKEIELRQRTAWLVSNILKFSR